MTRRFSAKAVPVAGLLAAFGMVCSAPANASDTSIYGYFDLGYIKESGSQVRMGRGQNNWIGVMGKEDLGGGTSAIFNLQARFDPTNGQQEKPSTFFQGESTVGFSNPEFGTIRFGRAMTPLWAKKWVFDPWYDSWLMGSLARYNGDFDSDGLPSIDDHNYSRVSGAVFYSSPTLSGFDVHLEAETQKPDGARSRSTGLSINYANGPLAAMLAYEENHLSDKIVYIAGSWKFGKWITQGAYSHTDYNNPPERWDWNKKRSMMLAGNYLIGADRIRFGHGRIKEDDSHKTSIGYNHALSKRTNLYADIYRERTNDSKKGAHDSMDGIAIGMNHVF